MASSIAARRRMSSNGLSICPAKPAALMRWWSDAAGEAGNGDDRLVCVPFRVTERAERTRIRPCRGSGDRRRQDRPARPLSSREPRLRFLPWGHRRPAVRAPGKSSRAIFLSSTTRMRRPSNLCSPPVNAPLAPGSSAAVSSTRGSRIVTSVPWPGPLLAIVTVPLWASTSFLTSARPMPSPACIRRVPSSCCLNISKTNGRNSAAMPSPVSRT